MKLLKFFALSLITVLVLAATFILATFAMIGANQMLATAPITGIWADLAVAYTSLLVNGSISFLVFMAVVLWFIWLLAIFRDELRAILSAIMRIRISVKKDDTL